MQSMRTPILAAVALSLTGCTPSWPADEFPAEAKVERTLFAEGQSGLGEGCEALVVELTDSAATLLTKMRSSKGTVELVPPAVWQPTPMPFDPKAHTYFDGAFNGCNNEGRQPIGDLPGALRRPGAFYRVINLGEGIAIIVPYAKLAGYFYEG